MPVQLRIFHAGAVAFAGAKNGELGLSLQPGGELLAVLSAQTRQVFPGGFTCSIKQGGQNNQRHQHDAAERQRDGNIQKTQPQRHHDNHYKRAHHGRNDAQIEVIQRIHICDHAVE